MDFWDGPDPRVPPPVPRAVEVMYRVHFTAALVGLWPEEVRGAGHRAHLMARFAFPTFPRKSTDERAVRRPCGPGLPPQRPRRRPPRVLVRPPARVRSRATSTSRACSRTRRGVRRAPPRGGAPDPRSRLSVPFGVFPRGRRTRKDTDALDRLYWGAFDADREPLLGRLRARRGDFAPLASFLDDEFKLGVMLAYDEAMSTAAWRRHRVLRVARTERRPVQCLCAGASRAEERRGHPLQERGGAAALRHRGRRRGRAGDGADRRPRRRPGGVPRDLPPRPPTDLRVDDGARRTRGDADPRAPAG